MDHQKSIDADKMPLAQASEVKSIDAKAAVAMSERHAECCF